MALGYDREQNVVNLGDTADLYAYIFDREDAPVDAADLLSVEFTIQKPDGTKVVEDGEILADGSGFLLFTGTDQRGGYAIVAKFTFVDGQVRSTRTDIEVLDPFKTEYDPAAPDYDAVEHYESIISDKVWKKINDLFDSADGGPWMMDMTMNVFSPDRIRDFIPEALFDINIYMPPTEFSLDTFARPVPADLTSGKLRDNPNLTVIVQGTLLAVVRHLMRSYTEQPTPAGGQVTYEDRRDYLQRWGTIYQIEHEWFQHLVKNWKRQFMGLHESKNLVSSKAGRLLPAPLRTRNIGRGYY